MKDIVIVTFGPKHVAMAAALRETLESDPSVGKVIVIDNSVENRGFARACNLGALQATADVIGFINPDAIVSGTLEAVEACFAEHPKVMVTGCRFGKTDFMLDLWSVNAWICGAAFFVRRAWFEQLGRFDEAFRFGYEETDFIRRTELAGLEVKDISLPIQHESPADDSVEVMVWKVFYMTRGWEHYKAKHRLVF